MVGTGFEGRHVAVTGGSGALGTAVVGRLIAQGAICHIPVFIEDELKRFPHTEHEQVRTAVGVDLTDENSAAKFYSDCPELWASIQIAGGFAMAPIAETSAADFTKMMKLNALSCFISCREALKRIRASGGEGRLVNVAARPALVPGGGMVAYAASKAAVASMTQSMAEELAPEGIWVNAVVPSILDTKPNRDSMPDADHSLWPKTDEVAATIEFLASPQNGVTRGALVSVYGKA